MIETIKRMAEEVGQELRQASPMVGVRRSCVHGPWRSERCSQHEPKSIEFLIF
jgi:hypothetical protein